jgi:hypothetical protein
MTMQADKQPVANSPHLAPPNAMYICAEGSIPLRMALDRDTSTVADVDGILGFARRPRAGSHPNPNMWIFTVDGYIHNDPEHTYIIDHKNLRFIKGETIEKAITESPDQD